MLWFRRKIKGPITLELATDEFCKTWFAKERECAYGLKLIADASFYNFLHRNGAFLASPLTGGGDIYPFSKNPRKKGSRAQKRKYDTVKMITVSNGHFLKMPWGFSPKEMTDVNGDRYKVGVHGVVFLKLHTGDGGTKAYTFFRSIAAQAPGGEVNDQYLRKRLLEAYENVIAAEVQTCLRESPFAFAGMVGHHLDPAQALAISEAACNRIVGLFDRVGLEVVTEGFTSNSLVSDETVIMRA